MPEKTGRSRVKSALGIDRVICRDEGERIDSGSSKHTRPAWFSSFLSKLSAHTPVMCVWADKRRKEGIALTAIYHILQPLS